MTQPSLTSESFSSPLYIAGNYPVVTRERTIAGEQTLPRGAVLGRVTASGEYVLSDDGAADGSEVPRAILVDEVDTTGGAVAMPVYLTGEFNQDALTFGGNHDAASAFEPLREVGIFLTQVTKVG